MDIRDEKLPIKLKMKMVITMEEWPNDCKLNLKEYNLKGLQSIIINDAKMMWH